MTYEEARYRTMEFTGLVDQDLDEFLATNNVPVADQPAQFEPKKSNQESINPQVAVCLGRPAVSIIDNPGFYAEYEQ